MTHVVKYELRHGNYTGVFATWEEAAEEAVQLGVGRWLNKHEFQLDQDAVIKAVHHEE